MGNNQIIMEEFAMSPVPTPKVEGVVDTLSFPEAIGEVMKMKKITRKEWNDVGTYGFLNGDVLSLHKSDNVNYKWIISDGDLMATDWYVLW